MVTTYIVGGTPRAGKSLLQKMLIKKHSISGITTDLLREGLKNGVPSFGIKGDGQNDLEKSEILWPYFKGILRARKSGQLIKNRPISRTISLYPGQE